MTTCQICARDIKALTGVIAHHGYKRPGNGWQTASCFGARYKPYEEACDALPLAINSAKNFLANQKRYLKEFTETPPETLSKQTSWAKQGEVYQRPEGFNTEENEKQGSHRAWTYESEHSHRLYMIKQSIKSAERDIDFMEKRLATWKVTV